MIKIVSLLALVDTISKATAKVVFDHGCTATDPYGSNTCTWNWGEKVGVTYNVSLGTSLTAANKLVLSAKVDKIVPLEVNCPVCGDKCTIKIPGKPIEVQLPPCPINAAMLHNTTFFTLPSKDPLPVGLTLTGTLILTDTDGTTPLDKVDVVGAVNP
eukprot:gene15320-20835_t